MKGIVLDTSLLIVSERQRESVEQLIERVQIAFGHLDVVISSVSAVELTHGIFRASDVFRQDRRRRFVDEVLSTIAVIPLTLPIAQLAGRIEGEEAARGIAIPFQDLLIGATALHLGYAVATRNDKHFKLIPGLTMTSV